MRENYGLILYWDVRNNCFVATSPDIIACQASGKTRQEALEALEQEAEQWLRVRDELERSAIPGAPEVSFPLPPTEPANAVGQKPHEPLKRMVKEDTLRGTYIRIETEEDAPVVHVEGEIDVNTSYLFRETLNGIVDAGKRGVLVDLSRTAYVDSSGLAALLFALKRLRARNGTLIAAGANSMVRRVLHLTKFDTIMMVVDSLDEARKLLDEVLTAPD